MDAGNVLVLMAASNSRFHFQNDWISDTLEFCFALITFLSDETRKRVSRCQLSSVTTSDLIKNDKNYVRGHPYITSAHFWTFLDPPTHTPTHPLGQHKYNTECQQKLQLFEPTHPVLCWRNTWMVPNLVKTILISSLKFCMNPEYVLHIRADPKMIVTKVIIILYCSDLSLLMQCTKFGPAQSCHIGWNWKWMTKTRASSNSPSQGCQKLFRC